MRFLTVFLLVLGLALPAHADEARPHITVTGEGRVEMRPDMATVTLGVMTEAETADAALAANSERLAEVLAILREQGIEERDIQTSGLSLSPRYENRPEPTEAGRPQITGFFASNMLTVRVRALDSLGGVLDTVVRTGANTLHGLSFGLQEPEPVLDEARRAAVADARRKAELYAGAAGVTLGPVLSISDQTSWGPPQPVMMAEASFARAAADVPVASGEVSLIASVTIVYGLGE